MRVGLQFAEALTAVHLGSAVSRAWWMDERVRLSGQQMVLSVGGREREWIPMPVDVVAEDWVVEEEEEKPAYPRRPALLALGRAS